MKLNTFKSTLLVSSLVLSAIACTNSKTAKSVDSKATQTSSETTTVNGKTTSEKYSYRFEENGCDTEVKNFTSIEEMCVGLQDEKQNNFCAPEAREQRFKEVCSGTYSPFVSDSMGRMDLENQLPDTKQAGSVNPEKMALREFKTKDTSLEVFKLKPDISNTPESGAMTIVSCDSSPLEITTSKRNGIQVLPSSKLVLTRDLNYTFKDGSSTANAEPFSAITCAAQEGEKPFDLTMLDKTQFQVRELKTTSTVYDIILTSPEVEGAHESGLVAVGCGDDVTYPTSSKMNGIYLTKGSSIVFARDLNSKFIDVHGSISKTPYVIFTCN